MFDPYFEKFPEFMDVFRGLDENVTCSATLLDALERFVCYMYVKTQYSSVNKPKYILFSQMPPDTFGQILGAFDGIDLSFLPPCRASLDMHAHRTNYQVYRWCHAQKKSKRTKP